MPAAPIRTAFAVTALFGAVACSRAPGAGAFAAVAASGDTPNACARDLAPGDLAQILGPSGVTVKAMPSNPEACGFEGPDNTEVVVGLRAGEEVEPFWKLTVNVNNNRMTPLAGVGETALRTPEGATVLARRGGLSCQVDVVGIDAILGQKAIDGNRDVLARKLGALCAKVFAARRA